jgi:hypothetical protein
MNKNIDSRCSARAKTGKPCRAAATAGGLYYFHANPKKASELGRIGGRRKRFSVAENADPLPKLESAMAVRDAVAQLVADVYAGKMNPRVASGLAPLLSLQLRVIETTDLEQRLVKVEKQLATPDKDVDSNKRDLDLDRNKPLISFAPESG